MLKLSFTAVSTAAFLLLMSDQGSAQQSTKPAALPELTTTNIFAQSTQQVAQVRSDELDGNLLVIYEAQRVSGNRKIYYFLPLPYIDWSKLARDVDQQCSSNQTNQTLSFHVQFYWDELLDEIARLIQEKLRVAAGDFTVGVPPNVGATGYVYDEQSHPFEAFNTIPQIDLLRNVQLSSLGSGLPKVQTALVRGTCDDLRSIAKRRELRTYVFSVGARAKVNQLAAAAGLLVNQNLFSDLQNAESQVSKTTVSSESGGGHIAINVGPLSLGGGGQQAQTTTDVNRYRIVNRAWIDSNLAKAVTQAQIVAVCDDDCSSSKTMDDLFKMFFGQLQSEKIKIEQDGDRAWAVKADTTRLPINQIKLDEATKSILGQAGKYKDNSEFEYEGIKAKNENDKNIQLDSNVGFEQRGDAWVPTTFNAYVINTAQLQRNISINYQQTVIGATSSIAMYLPQLTSRGRRKAPHMKWQQSGNNEREITLEPADSVSEIYLRPSWITGVPGVGNEPIITRKIWSADPASEAAIVAVARINIPEAKWQEFLYLQDRTTSKLTVSENTILVELKRSPVGGADYISAIGGPAPVTHAPQIIVRDRLGRTFTLDFESPKCPELQQCAIDEFR
ncbi:hypothetical protein UB31_21235 [Bradyrhizobium sp. LTSP849]|uniref:hypothetical protein n=1 Tax=Bradyrhizobium sp. LTSP849 TaxID=1615890 RepID=UPI0005D14F5C|nr:hypothetical protein [Bradyrhizobium sp. LTSP849]KJC44104.1 hypothetical protein UB31_21235 [Bradyrhizobium sp. LTSP849]